PLQERWRNRQAEGLRGLEINDQFELRRLLHRQVTRLGTPKNLNDVGCRAAIRIGHRNAIRHQAPPSTPARRGHMEASPLRSARSLTSRLLGPKKSGSPRTTNPVASACFMSANACS